MPSDNANVPKILELDPRTIKFNPVLNARRISPSKKRILELAEDFANPDIGQMTPIEVRKNGQCGWDWDVVFGATRTAAAVALVTGDGIKKMADFKIQAIEFVGDDSTAYQRSVIENKRRNDTTHLDDAYAVTTLKDTYGKTDAEIGVILGVSQSWVGILRSVTTTIIPIQKLVEQGHILPREAKDIAALSKAQQKEVAEEIKAVVDKDGSRLSALNLPAPDVSEGDDDKGKTKAPAKPKKTGKAARSKKVAATVRKAVKKAKGAGKPTATEDGPKPPTRAEMVRFWQDIVDTDENENLKAFAKMNIKYINGTAGETAMTNSLDKVFPPKKK